MGGSVSSFVYLGRAEYSESACIDFKGMEKHRRHHGTGWAYYIGLLLGFGSRMF